MFPFCLTAVYDLYFDFAGRFQDVDQYYNESSLAFKAMKQTEAQVRALLEDPQFEMIGKGYLQLLEETVAASVDAAKPWQIFSSNVPMGLYGYPDPLEMYRFFPDPEDKALVKKYVKNLYEIPGTAVLMRYLTAMALTYMTYNRDVWDGHAHERAAVLEIARTVANNMIVVAGDVHDAYAMTLFERGENRGEPVAVSLVTPGVGAKRLQLFLEDFFGFQDVLDLDVDDVRNAWRDLTVDYLPGGAYADFFNRGFFAAKVTPTTHTAEYIRVDYDTSLKDYATARAESGSITAEFSCGVSLTTQASEKGSLQKEASCGAISFQTERSALLSIPVPDAAFPSPMATRLVDCGLRGCVVEV